MSTACAGCCALSAGCVILRRPKSGCSSPRT
jgi:hypothetical protein